MKSDGDGKSWRPVRLLGLGLRTREEDSQRRVDCWGLTKSQLEYEEVGIVKNTTCEYSFQIDKSTEEKKKKRKLISNLFSNNHGFYTPENLRKCGEGRIDR